MHCLLKAGIKLKPETSVHSSGCSVARALLAPFHLITWYSGSQVEHVLSPMVCMPAKM